MFDIPKLTGVPRFHKQHHDKNLFSIEVNKYNAISEE